MTISMHNIACSVKSYCRNLGITASEDCWSAFLFFFLGYARLFFLVFFFTRRALLLYLRQWYEKYGIIGSILDEHEKCGDIFSGLAEIVVELLKADKIADAKMMMKRVRFPLFKRFEFCIQTSSTRADTSMSTRQPICSKFCYYFDASCIIWNCQVISSMEICCNWEFPEVVAMIYFAEGKYLSDRKWFLAGHFIV